MPGLECMLVAFHHALAARASMTLARRQSIDEGRALSAGALQLRDPFANLVLSVILELKIFWWRPLMVFFHDVVGCDPGYPPPAATTSSDGARKKHGGTLNPSHS